MNVPDLVNGLFEFSGGLFIIRDCIFLYRDKKVKGVSKLSRAFFTSWGIWNLYYYPHLEQIYSFLGGLVIVIANVWWNVMAWYYNRKERKGQL